MAVTVKLHPTNQAMPARPPPLPLVPLGWGFAFDPVFAKPNPVIPDMLPGLPVQPPPPAPQGWGRAFDPVFAKANPVIPETPVLHLIPTKATPQGWIPAFDPTFAKTTSPAFAELPLALQKPVPPATFPNGFFSPLEWARVNPINAALHDFFAPLPRPELVVTSADVSFDAIVNMPRLVGDDVWSPLFPPPSAGGSGRGAPGSPIGSVLRIKLHPTNPTLPLKQTQAFPTPIFDWLDLNPEVFTRPFPAALHWSAFQPQGAIASSTPQGWFAGYQLDYQFAKQFPSNEQQHTSFEPRTNPTTPPPFGWYRPLEIGFTPPRGIESIPFAPPKLVVQINTTVWRQQPLDLPQFKVPFSVALQQYMAGGLVPEGQITPPVVIIPPGGGGHRKPIRPIWDRREENERAAAAAQAAFDAIPPEQRPGVVHRATGIVLDAHDSAAGAATVHDPVTRGSGGASEAGDVARALAQTNDDDLATRLLEEARQNDRKGALSVLNELLAEEDDPEAAEHYQAIINALKGH